MLRGDSLAVDVHYTFTQFHKLATFTIMAASTTLCGICDLRHITKPSIIWCSDCDEGLCDDCKEHHSLSKASRNHNTVPIAEHQKLPDYVLSIQEFCAEHNEKFLLFCKKHDCPCCRVCVVEQHNKCEDIAVIESVVQGAKTGNSFQEYEALILEILETIKQFRKEKETNIADISEQRKTIEIQIKEIRSKINNHLDKLQEKLIRDLTDAETNIICEANEVLTSLDEQEKQLIDCQNNMSYIKQYASDLKTFLSMKKIEHEITLKDALIKSVLESNKMNKTNIVFTAEPPVAEIITELQRFGKVDVESRPCELMVVRSKDKQAQITTLNMPYKNIENITVALQQKINTTGENTRGCKLLPGGDMVFSFYSDDQVIFMNADGSTDSIIKLKSAFDSVYIEEDGSIAVTSGGDNVPCINLIDIGNKTIKQTIAMTTDVDGIVALNKKIFFCCRNNGLQMMNLEDRSIKTIVKREIAEFAYIAACGEKLYYTNSKTNTVTCCNIEGTEQWQFSNESCLKGPLGISVDSDGNVYVVGGTSYNVVVLSPDGQRYRELLSSKDGLHEPRVLHYEQTTNRLLVANKNGTMSLFKVSG